MRCVDVCHENIASPHSLVCSPAFTTDVAVYHCWYLVVSNVERRFDLDLPFTGVKTLLCPRILEQE